MEFLDDGYGSFGSLVYPIPLQQADAIILGIPYEGALGGNPGASYAPQVIRQLSKDMQTISRRGIDMSDITIADIGNVPIYKLNNEKTRESIRNSISYLLKESPAPIISIGGDHSITYPILQAMSENEKIGVIWFDAHPDLLDTYLDSKFSHGSPLRRSIELDNINPENVLLVGTRYWEMEEKRFIKENGVREIPMHFIEERQDALFALEEEISGFAKKVDHLYISIDIDVLDPAYAPGTGTPVAGGMSTSHLLSLLWSINHKIRAFDIVEISPPMDHANITSQAGLAILNEILAKPFSE